MKATITYHRHRFHLSFPYDSLLVEEVRRLPDRYWDKKQQVWVLQYSDALRDLCLRWPIEGWVEAYNECESDVPAIRHLDAAFLRAITK